MAAPLIPPDLNAQLRAWAPNGRVVPLESTVGGFSNLSFTAKAGGEVCVVKAASAERKRGDVRREADVLGRLLDAEPEFPVPEVMVLLEGSWTVLVTRFVEGTGALTVRTTPAGLRARAELLGRLLASVHACAIGARGTDDDLDIARRAATAARDVSSASLDRSLATRLRQALEHPALQRGVALVHGDFGLHNVLWSASGRTVRVAALLDWEWAGWGNPLGDVAWLWWTFEHRALGAEAWAAFLSGYGPWAVRALGWEPHTVVAMVRAQMAQILLRTSAGSSHRDEWLARIDALDRLVVPEV